MTALFLATFFLCAAEASAPDPAQQEQPRVSETETWNEGVDAYRAGDFTNALRVLRPLMLSKTYGARAAEVVAALSYSRGDLEEAASAAQIALRASPDDAKAMRNFTRAVDGLPKMRAALRVERLMKEAQGKDPGSMMLSATREARDLMTASAGFRTNEPVRAVALADSLSRRALALADVWIPVREMIAGAVTNEEQAATIVLQIEGAEAKTKKAAEELGDLSDGAYSLLSDVEHDCTRFLKMTASPPSAIAEDEIAQSNAWMDVAAFNGRSWQQDALDYTRSFRANFPAWARAYEQQAQSDTNKPPFTAEDQAKVSSLAMELEKIQMGCVGKSLPPEQEKALGIIRQIRELLPKDNSGGGGQNRQNQNQNQNQQNQQNRQDRKQSDEGDQEQNETQGEQEENPPEEEKDGGEPEEQSPEDQEIEATLKKAQERNDEHEAEKKARMRKAPLPPNERDW